MGNHQLPPKNIRPDPNHDDYVKKWTALYEGTNYDDGLTGYFLRKSHEWAESNWDNQHHFGSVLEVGAGSGVHVSFVNHGFDEYLMTDLNMPLIESKTERDKKPGQGDIKVASEDATQLSFADNRFDRVIATHVLEHLERPHQVVQEWARVLKPGGTLSLVLPCDPGAAWRLGRYLVARNKFLKAGIQYDYWMAREHINPINNLVSLVRHYFPDAKEKWLPLGVPSIDLNLFYIAHLKV